MQDASVSTRHNPKYNGKLTFLYSSLIPKRRRSYFVSIALCQCYSYEWSTRMTEAEGWLEQGSRHGVEVNVIDLVSSPVRDSTREKENNADSMTATTTTIRGILLFLPITLLHALTQTPIQLHQQNRTLLLFPHLHRILTTFHHGPHRLHHYG